MPKERIQHGKQYATWEAEGTGEYPGAIFTKEFKPDDPDVPKNATIKENPSLEISWYRDGGGTDASGQKIGWAQFAVEIPIWKLEELAAQYLTEPHDELVSVWLHLEPASRTELNHAIRTIRRARAAAYGADE